MMLCLEAQDEAADHLKTHITPLTNFIQELIAPSTCNEILHSKPTRARTFKDTDKTLEATFHQSKMYFNHFVKLHDHKAINRGFLLALVVHGAAGICTDFQYRTDIIIPFLYQNTPLQWDDVLALFIQCKNDASYQATPQKHLFDMMDPYHIQFFNADEKNPVPVIHMVFALASSTPSVVALQNAERIQPSRQSAFKANFQANKYTTFDIWCGKASQETFRPIKDDNASFT